MRNKLILIIFTSFIAITVFAFPKDTVSLGLESINYFYDVVLPSLFPFLLVLFIFIETGIYKYLAYLLQYLTIPLFRVNGSGCIIILVSILMGFPYSAMITILFIKNNKLNKKEASIIISTMFFASYSFIFSSIGSALNNYHAARIISLSLYLSSFVMLYIISSFTLEKPQYISFSSINNEVKEQISSFNFLSSLKNNSKNLIDTLTIILGTMVYFSLFSLSINHFIQIPDIISGLIEFSYPSLKIASLGATKNNMISLIIILSFSSLSAIMQAFAFLDEAKISLFLFMIIRILLIPISITVLLLLI